VDGRAGKGSKGEGEHEAACVLADHDRVALSESVIYRYVRKMVRSTLQGLVVRVTPSSFCGRRA
jgi:hypothetical protein